MKAQLDQRPTADSIAELQAKLDAVEEEKALADKSAMERLEHKYSKELERREKLIAELTGKAEEFQQGIAQRDATLKSERVSRALGDALDRHKVYQSARGDAIRVLTGELGEVEIDENGIRASWGDLVDETPEKIAEAFLQNRQHYLAAEGGGAGTRKSNAGGRSHTNLHELPIEELMTMAEQQDRQHK